MSVSKKEYFKQLSVELHKPAKKKFPRQTVRSDGPNDIWSVDLVDLGEWKDQNDGYRYLLNIVDVYSRYAWSVPLKTKTAAAVWDAFMSVGILPKKLWVDRGSEFYNTTWTKKLKDLGITRYSTYSESKSVIVERFNRTLKTSMFKFFTENATRKWLRFLPAFIKAYNNRKHSTTGQTPAQRITQKPVESQTKTNIYIEPRKTLFDIGDRVRISRQKGVFEKSYTPAWSSEIFTVSQINFPPDNEPVTYNLVDWHMEPIEGSFYDAELQKTKYPDIYIVEDVLKTKKVKGVTWYLIKWVGYREPTWTIDAPS